MKSILRKGSGDGLSVRFIFAPRSTRTKLESLFYSPFKCQGSETEFRRFGRSGQTAARAAFPTRYLRIRRRKFLAQESQYEIHNTPQSNLPWRRSKKISPPFANRFATDQAENPKKYFNLLISFFLQFEYPECPPTGLSSVLFYAGGSLRFLAGSEPFACGVFVVELLILSSSHSIGIEYV